MRIVLLAREPLLLRRRHDFAVADQCCRGVVVKRRDAYNPHRIALSQNNVYMNGATAEPCASTIRPPRITITSRIGMSQYFLRVRMYAHNSLRNDMAPS